jgi:hypothetical protein
MVGGFVAGTVVGAMDATATTAGPCIDLDEKVSSSSVEVVVARGLKGIVARPRIILKPLERTWNDFPLSSQGCLVLVCGNQVGADRCRRGVGFADLF